ncbi:MAG: DUF3370 family protein [Synechococcaceae bacterium WB9_2_112]|nr:DUF3370 family protein [Synechococcaceae bacterium WB9_2_112]
MNGQRAKPLNGRFNTLPVLHSNQPEEVEGPGVLINTAPGVSFSTETGQSLRNAEYTFNGDFGVHLHHKYFPQYRGQISPSSRRTELTLGLILINPGSRPVHIRFMSGAVRNSFEAPYLANSMNGVRPLGPRPWNTGPGDATAVQMLRNKLDARLSETITLAPNSRSVLFQTDLPALGIANALLRGQSDGPFQMAVVAARQPRSSDDLMAVLDQGVLAPGRVYLNRIAEIQNRQVFSRVGGVALGDEYQASVTHNLATDGALHVPLTSTQRHTFGTNEVQVNPLVSRMLDSSLDNVGTYGVRFIVDMNLRGEGPYELVMSHPSAVGGKQFTAFRGSIQIQTEAGVQEFHVVLRSGQSLPLTSLALRPGVNNPVRLTLVYPADATPGHLLSVVPAQQLVRLRQLERDLELARRNPSQKPSGLQPLPPLEGGAVQPGLDESVAERLQRNASTVDPLPPPRVSGSNPGSASTLSPAGSGGPLLAPPPLTEPNLSSRQTQSLVDRYQQALDAQNEIMRGLMSR